jgi:hypothetical protein
VAVHTLAGRNPVGHLMLNRCPDSPFGIVGSAVTVNPWLPYWAKGPECFGSRSFAYTTWHAVQPDCRKSPGLSFVPGMRARGLAAASFASRETRIGAQPCAESLSLSLTSGLPPRSSVLGLPISDGSPFNSPPRSNTRRILPGCVISQRGSALNKEESLYSRSHRGSASDS